MKEINRNNLVGIKYKTIPLIGADLDHLTSVKEQEREKLYEAVYQSEHWKNIIAPKIESLMDRPKINVQRIEPTKLSALR